MGAQHDRRHPHPRAGAARRGDDRRGHRGGPAPRGGRSRTVGKAPLVVGGQPRANLLPPEIILKRKQLKTRRALRAGVVLVAHRHRGRAASATFGVASVAQVQLAAAQQTQAELVAEQGEYSEVREVQDTIATITAGQLVGASTEIAWQDYLIAAAGARCPQGVVAEERHDRVGHADGGVRPVGRARFRAPASPR